MKKPLFWLSIAAVLVLAIDVLVMGIKLMDGDDEVIVEGYVALTSLALWGIGLVGRTVLNKCPHCGKKIEG